MSQVSHNRKKHSKNEPRAAVTEKTLSALLHKLAFDEFGVLDTAALIEDDCTCESCKHRRLFSRESIEEIKLIQSCWLELRQYVRIVYRLSMKGSLKSIDEDYQDYMKDIVSRLIEVCDPHQLFQRLEAQVKEFVVEVKVLLLQILDKMADNPQLPHLFITGLLDRYQKLVSAGNVIAPVLKQLEEEHLNQFSFTWKLLNQRLFQSVIYSDVFFQNSVPVFISQLRKLNGDDSRVLVKQFLSFDNELGLIEGLWIDIDSNMSQYLQKKTSVSEKKKILINDWEEFKTAKRHEHMAVLENNVTAGLISANGMHVKELHGITIEGIEPEMLAESCECHVCLEAPLHGPVELFEQVIPLGNHRGFHLYPHIHGGGREESASECELPELCGQTFTKEEILSGTFAKGLSKLSKLDHNHPNKHHQHSHPHPLHPHHQHPHPHPPHSHSHPHPHAHPHAHGHPHPHQHQHHHQSNGKKRVDKATQKDQENANMNGDNVKPENLKKVPGVVQNSKDNTSEKGTSSSSPHVHCTKHSDIKRIPCTEQDEDGNDDSHSDNSQSDPRHCDCCYCEVFGHGLPSAAPMSRNYQEMRERLRLLLSKKKSKCKSSPPVPPQPVTHRKHQTPGANPPPSSEIDTRALEDLLDFIEGTEVKCRNEKKAAKKARQKEKKRILLNRKKREEEEKARLLEQSIQQKKREEALAKEAEEKAARLSAKSKKKGGKANVQVPTEKPAATQSKPGPQMVTIKRVMEPHNSEPTVTITLRGATPNQDRVLYTLLNGQVCKVKDVPAEKKNNSANKNNQQKNNPSQAAASKNKEHINNEKVKIKKETVRNVNPPPQLQNIPVMPNIPTITTLPNISGIPNIPNIKPVKELTNPTSIQINNAINNMSKKPSPSFNIADIKLPPGITITKVDPSNVQSRANKIQENNTKKVNASQIRPQSEVIVVSTGKRKEPTVLKEPSPETPNGKKKRNKKKTASSNENMQTNGKGSSYPGLEIQPIKIIDAEKEQDLSNRMSVLTISPYSDNNVGKTDNGKKKKKKSKKSTANGSINPEEWKLLDQSRSTEANIRVLPVEEDHRNSWPVNTIDHCGERIVENNKNEFRSKKRQKKSTDNGLINSEGLKNLDSVFAPKDIDLDDGDMDDAERELEAFKRFCLQSIPPERKEKVHLNIKDIVLKKKAASFNY